MKKKYYAYVIQSLKEQSYYKGHCANIDERLRQHNAGNTISIKSKIPYKVVYFEMLETVEEAIKRERYFKTSTGRRFLKSKLTDSNKV